MLEKPNEKTDPSDLIQITVQPTQEVLDRLNSRIGVVVSFYPMPNPRHPKFKELLATQLSTSVMHLRGLALRLGAHAVTSLRFHESATEQATDMGRLSAQLVQLKEHGADQSTAAGRPLDATTPLKHYEKHKFPPTILGHEQEFEIMIERA